MNMNMDMLQNIMLMMDIKTLFNFFKVNKQIYAIYNNIYFWEQKFVCDDLKYLGLEKPNNINDFIKSYITSTFLKEELYPKIFYNNKASVLLINIEDECEFSYCNTNESCMIIESYMDIHYKNWRLYLRRGDIIENIARSGYRSEGICMYDGTHIIPINHDADDYGSPSKTFIIFKDFLPEYWNKAFDDDVANLNIITKYIDRKNMEKSSNFYWHADPPPTVIYKPIIIQQVKNKYKDVINKATNPVITINFASQNYNIYLTITQINEIITTGTITDDLYLCEMDDNNVYCHY